MAAQARHDFAPYLLKTRLIDALAEIRRKQRSVVVAQFGAEPGQPVREPAAQYGKRQQEQQLPKAVAARDDGGSDAVPASDVTLPNREPIEALEHGAVGDHFECAP